MNKGTHFSGQPMYGQLIDLLDKDEILKFSRAHHGERYVKHFDAYQHLIIMLYAVIRRFDSLREISDSMFPESRKLAHLPDAAHCRMPTPAGLKYTFLEDPARDWAKMVQNAKESPPEPSLVD